MSSQVLVDVFRTFMEDASEGSGIYLGTDFFGYLKSGYVFQIELQRTIQVIIQCRRGEHGFLIVCQIINSMHPLDDLWCLRDTDSGTSLWRLTGNQGLLDDRLVGFDEVLQHESAPFTSVQAIRTIVVHQAYFFGTLQEAIEIVGINRNLMVDGGHAKCLA